MTADYYMELHHEAFLLWLASVEAIPANDNPCARRPYEGWSA